MGGHRPEKRLSTERTYTCEASRPRVGRRRLSGVVSLAALPYCAFMLLASIRGGAARRMSALGRPLAAFQLAGAPAAPRFPRLQPLCSFGAISSQPFSAPKQPTGSNKPAEPVLVEGLELVEFRKLGLSEEVLQAVQQMGFDEPSSIQKLAVPEILRGDDIAFSAATGSGKTLAYLLPIMQLLKWQEQAGKPRQSMRPRALILVPTRELVQQVLEVTKQLSHIVKLSSCGLHGGEDWGVQRRRLQGEVDVVVASPGRLLQHYEKGHLFFSQVSHVVIDEMDTMLKDGFGPDIKKLLTPLEMKSKREKVQYLMSTATLTPAVKRLMEAEAFPPTRFLQSNDAHKSLPNMKHVMLDTKGTDKVQMLIDVLYESRRKGERVMVFCNTVNSCRAVEHALKEVSLDSICYHGDMHSEERQNGLERFKEGKVQFMVCTDVAARGLDLPLVEHVVMFDFPLNPIEYLHRSGRTARMGAKGKVTSLLQKRDKVLASAIQSAVARGLPLDALSARKRDYEQGGKLSGVLTGRPSAARKPGNRHSRRGSKPSEGSATPKGKGGKPLVGGMKGRGGVGAGRFGKARVGGRR